VLDGLVGGVGVVAGGGTNPRELARGDGHPGPAAADDDAALGGAVAQRPRHRFRRVRIVDRGSGMAAEVNDVVALLDESGGKLLFEVETRVIRSDCQLHALRYSTGRTCWTVVYNRQHAKDR
jgi:hypothetical protein